MRPPVARPDLTLRLRLLLAQHPGLAAQVERGDWLGPELLAWVDAIAALPPGSTAGNVLERLRSTDPRAVRAFEQALASDASALADLSAAEAAAELLAALDQLRERHLRRLIDALVRTGMASDADRQRYQELSQQLLALKARV